MLRRRKGDHERNITHRNEDTKEIRKQDGMLNYLWSVEDGSQLSMFRILWGILMCIEAYILLTVKTDYYSSVSFGFHAKYYLFEWISLPPVECYEAVIFFFFISSFFVVIGYCYRLSAIAMFISRLYIFLWDAQLYSDMKYIVTVTCFLFIFLPCNQYFCFDNRNSKESRKIPKIYIIFMRVYVGVIYFYITLSQLHTDWLRGSLARYFYPSGKSYSINQALAYELGVYSITFIELLFHMISIPLLMFESTLLYGFLMNLGFYFYEYYHFSSQFQPVLMIIFATLFLHDNWPFQLALIFPKETPNEKQSTVKSTTYQIMITILLVSFLLLWIIVPIRHHFTGNENSNILWDEEGALFSLQTSSSYKSCITDFHGIYPESKRPFFVPSYKLTPNPAFLIQYSRYLADLYTVDGERPEIYCIAACSLNFRSFNLLLNQSINYANELPWNCRKWIIPLPEYTNEERNELPWNWDLNTVWNRLTTENHALEKYTLLEQQKEETRKFYFKNLGRNIATTFGKVTAKTLQEQYPPGFGPGK